MARCEKSFKNFQTFKISSLIFFLYKFYFKTKSKLPLYIRLYAARKEHILPYPAVWLHTWLLFCQHLTPGILILFYFPFEINIFIFMAANTKCIELLALIMYALEIMSNLLIKLRRSLSYSLSICFVMRSPLIGLLFI